MTAVQTSGISGKVQEQIASLIPSSLRTDPAFLNTAKAIHSRAYMKAALNSITKYMKYRKVNSCVKLVHDRPHIIERQLIKFITDGCKGIANNSKRAILSHLKLMYIMNDVSVNWAKIGRCIGKREKVRNRAYKLEEIQKMADYADLRGKVIILLLASTGIRIDGLSTLRWQNLSPLSMNGERVYAIIVYEGEPEEYVTFCTPEAAKYVDAYIAFRQRKGEATKNTTPLIRDELDEREENPDKIRFPQAIRTDGLIAIVAKIVDGCGVRSNLSKTMDTKGGFAQNRFEAHLTRGFRKFHSTAMMKAGIEPVIRACLRGHLEGTTNLDSSNLAMIYTTPEQTDLFTEYLKAVDLLTIDPANRLQNKVKELETKNEIMESQYQRQYRKLTDLLHRKGFLTQEQYEEFNNTDAEEIKTFTDLNTGLTETHKKHPPEYLYSLAESGRMDDDDGEYH